MKLGNIFPGNTITITQTNHGKNQNNKAFDLRHPDKNVKDIIAPIDCRVEPTLGTGQQRYFRAKFNSKGTECEVEFVHCRAIKTGYFKKGQKIGEMVPHYSIVNGKRVRTDHCHVAIKVGGIWYVLPDYIDRTLKLTLIPGIREFFSWWSTYTDRHLPGTHPIAKPTEKPIEPTKQERIEPQTNLPINQTTMPEKTVVQKIKEAASYSGASAGITVSLMIIIAELLPGHTTDFYVALGAILNVVTNLVIAFIVQKYVVKL